MQRLYLVQRLYLFKIKHLGLSGKKNQKKSTEKFVFPQLAVLSLRTLKRK